MNSLLASSEGLHTIGWGVGFSSHFGEGSRPAFEADQSIQLLPEIEKVPKTMPQPSSKAAVIPVSAATVCPHYSRGFWGYGDGCKFEHLRESTSSVPLQVATSSQTPPIVCKHFAAGFCRRGSQCKFVHVATIIGTPEVPAIPSEESHKRHQPLAADKKELLRQAGLLNVCFRWARGRCKADNCRFSHQPLSAWDFSMLESLLDPDDSSPEACVSSLQEPKPGGPSVSAWDSVDVGSLQSPLILEPSAAPPASPKFTAVVQASSLGNLLKAKGLGPP